MSNKLSTFDFEEATNKIRNILNESKDMVLDEGLLRRIEIELEKRNSDIVKLLKNAEECRETENPEGHILKEIKGCKGIVDVIGEGLCLLNKDLKVIWANKTISDWLDLKESPVGSYCNDIFRCSEVGVGNCQAQNVLNGGEGHIIETWITTKTNKRICVQRIAIPITSENGDISNVLVHTVDVTESEKSVHRLLLLQHLGEVMQGTLHLDRLLHLVLTCVTTGYAFGFNRAMLFLINKENK
jgi:PAS fold.